MNTTPQNPLEHADPHAPQRQRYAITVLLVDDQALVAEAVRRALAHQPDVSFHYCAQAEQAIEAAERIQPTVILQDLVMPGVDGLTLVARYRSHPLLREVPVIVMSSKEEAPVKSAAFKSGASDYLVKLPDPIELLARIRHHSKSYINQLERDRAYHALHESQQQLLAANAELQRLSNTDSLTGLSSRRHLDAYLADEWKRGMRERQTLSLLMVDVDDFKRYNDAYGHLAGDEVLKLVAGLLHRCAERPADLAARFGGEEVAVVLPNTEVDGALHIAEEMQQQLRALAVPHIGSSNDGVLTMSIGVAACIPTASAAPQDLIQAADSALYSAKQAGRNRVAVAQIEPPADARN